MSCNPTALMKSGQWIMVAGAGLWLIGGVLLLSTSLIRWSPASAMIAGCVGWGMSTGTAILCGASLTIAGLKAENDRLRGAAGGAEPGTATDSGRDLRDS